MSLTKKMMSRVEESRGQLGRTLNRMVDRAGGLEAAADQNDPAIKACAEALARRQRIESYLGWRLER